MPKSYPWENVISLTPHIFDCGYCCTRVTGQVGYRHPFDRASGGGAMEFIYICACGKPTYFPDDPSTYEIGQIPGALAGHDVRGLPKDIADLWTEIRRGASSGVYSLAVMGCRKMLMHIAVEKGADEGKTFLSYVEYLDTKGYVPTGGKPWVAQLQKGGNRPNHKIVLSTREEAEKLIKFCGMLLRIIYELPLDVP